MPELLWKSYIDFEIAQGDWERTRSLYERLLERTTHVKVWISYARFEADRYAAQSGIRGGRGSGGGGDDEDDEDDEAGQGGGGGGGGGRGEEEEEEEDEDPLGGPLERARQIFERGLKHLKEESAGGAKEERVMLLEAWNAVEQGASAKAAAREDAQQLADAEAALKKLTGMMPKKIKKKRLLTGEDGAEAGWEEYIDYVFPDEASKTPNLRILEMAQKWKQAAKEVETAGGDDDDDEDDDDEEEDEEEEEEEEEGGGGDDDDDDDEEEDDGGAAKKRRIGD